MSTHEDGFVVDVGADVGVVGKKHEFLALENAGDGWMMDDGERRMDGGWRMKDGG